MRDVQKIGGAYLWIEQQGAIHIKASTEEGDPLELTADEAKRLGRLLLDMADGLENVDIVKES